MCVSSGIALCEAGKWTNYTCGNGCVDDTLSDGRPGEAFLACDFGKQDIGSPCPPALNGTVGSCGYQPGTQVLCVGGKWSSSPCPWGTDGAGNKYTLPNCYSGRGELCT